MLLVCMQRSAHMKSQAVQLFIVLCELVQEWGKRCLLHLNCFFPFFLLSALDKQNELHFVSFSPASEWHLYMKTHTHTHTHTPRDRKPRGLRNDIRQWKLEIVILSHFRYNETPLKTSKCASGYPIFITINLTMKYFSRAACALFCAG